MYSLDDYEEVYWDCWNNKKELTPEMFGCKDFFHNEKGEVDYWNYLPYRNIDKDEPVDLTPKDTSYDYGRDEAWENGGRDNFQKCWDRQHTYAEMMDAWALYEEYN